MAGASVTTTIRLEGQDRASAVIDGARKSIERTSGSLRKVAEQSGDLEKGFRGLGDLVGKFGGEGLSRLTHAFGGVEDVVKGLPGFLGPVGLAVGAVGAGFAYWHESIKKAREEAVKATTDVLDARAKDSALRADELRASRELFGASKALTGAEAEKAELVQRAALARKALDEDEKARAKARVDGEKQIEGWINLRIVRREFEIRAIDRQFKAITDAAEAEARSAEIVANRLTLRRLEAQGIANPALRATATAKIVEGELADLDARITLTRASVALSATERDRKLEVLAIERERLRLELQSQVVVKPKRGGAKRDWRFELQEQLDANMQRALLEEQADRDRRAANVERSRAEQRKMNEAYAAAANERNRIAEQERADDFRRSQERVALARQETEAKVEAAAGVASAVVSGLEQMGLAEQAAAGLKALISAAEAGLAAARGNWAGAVAGAFASVQFARVALGGGAPAVPGVGGGGAAAPAADLRPMGKGGGNTYVVNFGAGFLTGTKQEIGKSITGALRSLDGSGVPAAKGA